MALRRLLRSQRGSQMVEFALLAPILLYLVLCIPVFGMFTHSWMVVSGAARAGARAASLLRVQGSREAVARQAADQNMYLRRSDGDLVLFDPARDVQVRVQGGTVTVQVTYHQPSYLPLLSALLGGSGEAGGDTVPITAAATFVIEQGGSLK
ncbi:TadE/TadG family type IV pilus assembly protein [Symbiobacterium thermophilum]|nr:TadE/TadG family type IV pilus assembly protein [Symbiobacterium thermophilum]MBY6275747.1 hypothetical protein [Symbiobacterium thermophilum]OTA40465.1 MAG: hypothetical protein A6D92_17155 [Symbiobacterium thermophilum]